MKNIQKFKKYQKQTLRSAMGGTTATTVQGGMARATQPMPCVLPAHATGVGSWLECISYYWCLAGVGQGQPLLGSATITSARPAVGCHRHQLFKKIYQIKTLIKKRNKENFNNKGIHCKNALQRLK